MTDAQAIISGSKELLEEIARNHGLNLRFVQESQTCITGYYTDGPIALQAIGEYLSIDPQALPQWDELNFQEQTAIVSLMTGSVPWAMDNRFESEQFEDLLLSHPELEPRLRTNHRRSPDTGPAAGPTHSDTK